VRGLKNGDTVRGAAKALSAAPLTYSLRRDDLRIGVFCFAKVEDTEVFAERFGEALTHHGVMREGLQSSRALDDWKKPECADLASGRERHFR
jgi:hypothetical protein